MTAYRCRTDARYSSENYTKSLPQYCIFFSLPGVMFSQLRSAHKSCLFVKLFWSGPCYIVKSLPRGRLCIKHTFHRPAISVFPGLRSAFHSAHCALLWRYLSLEEVSAKHTFLFQWLFTDGRIWVGAWGDLVFWFKKTVVGRHRRSLSFFLQFILLKWLRQLLYLHIGIPTLMYVQMRNNVAWKWFLNLFKDASDFHASTNLFLTTV